MARRVGWPGASHSAKASNNRGADASGKSRQQRYPISYHYISQRQRGEISFGFHREAAKVSDGGSYEPPVSPRCE